MRRILIGLAAVLALGLCAIPALAGNFHHLRVHRPARVRVIRRDDCRVVGHPRFHRDVVIRHYRGRIVHRGYRR